MLLTPPPNAIINGGQMVTRPSWILWLSALGLLPALLLESDPNPLFILCKTPVGDEGASRGLLLELCKTSPRGPPTELPQEMGIQFTSLWLNWFIPLPTRKTISESISRDSLRGESARFRSEGE